MTVKVETNPKALKLKVNDRVLITEYKDIFSKRYTKNWSRKIFVIDYVSRTDPWAYKIQDLNGEKMKIFMKKNCC